MPLAALALPLTALRAQPRLPRQLRLLPHRRKGRSHSPTVVRHRGARMRAGLRQPARVEPRRAPHRLCAGCPARVSLARSPVDGGRSCGLAPSCGPAQPAATPSKPNVRLTANACTSLEDDRATSLAREPAAGGAIAIVFGLDKKGVPKPLSKQKMSGCAASRSALWNPFRQRVKTARR